MNITKIKNIKQIYSGFGAIGELKNILACRTGLNIFFVDIFFRNKNILKLPASSQDIIYYVDSSKELTTEYVDEILGTLRKKTPDMPGTIIGIGGGTALDTAKAISNLYTNPGKAENYQGWDLVKNPGIYKIGVPTLSGTGAESSRTCVMIKHENKLKLGMNSNFTIFDELILDPDLSKTVQDDQFFYTGMDTYIHSLESISGNYRNCISDAYAFQAINLCKEIFLSNDMKADSNREKLMTASYFGGVAIANSFVGIIHPLSAGISVVFDVRHCEANCIVMNAMEEFYPEYYQEFKEMTVKQDIKIPTGRYKDLSEEQYKALYEASIIHEKPLVNALGEDFKNILTYEKVKSLFKKM